MTAKEVSPPPPALQPGQVSIPSLDITSAGSQALARAQHESGAALLFELIELAELAAFAGLMPSALSIAAFCSSVRSARSSRRINWSPSRLMGFGLAEQVKLVTRCG